MNIILYTTGCPKCIILEKKMNIKNIKYEVNDDVDLMQKKGFMSLPMLEVDGVLYDFKTAVDYINDLEGYN